CTRKKRNCQCRRGGGHGNLDLLFGHACECICGGDDRESTRGVPAGSDRGMSSGGGNGCELPMTKDRWSRYWANAKKISYRKTIKLPYDCVFQFFSSTIALCNGDKVKNDIREFVSRKSVTVYCTSAGAPRR